MPKAPRIADTRMSMADAIKKSQAEAEERMMNEKSARERTTRDRPQGRRDERDRRLV